MKLHEVYASSSGQSKYNEQGLSASPPWPHSHSATLENNSYWGFSSPLDVYIIAIVHIKETGPNMRERIRHWNEWPGSIPQKHLQSFTPMTGVEATSIQRVFPRFSSQWTLRVSATHFAFSMIVYTRLFDEYTWVYIRQIVCINTGVKSKHTSCVLLGALNVSNLFTNMSPRPQKMFDPFNVFHPTLLKNKFPSHF